MTFIAGVGDAVGPIVVVFVVRGAARAGPDAARAPGRRCATRSSTARGPAGQHRSRSRAAAAWRCAAAFLLVAGGFLVAQRAARLVVPDAAHHRRRRRSSRCCSAVRSRPALGAIDDLFDLRARWQLLGQIALALLRSPLGITHRLHRQPVRRRRHPLQPGRSRSGFTVFWIVGMINSINWIDGLDGLSSGIAFIAAVTLGLISLTTQVGQPLIAVLCFALAGALLGFLRWNFHPATIFAGTSGVQFVGYTLAVLAILGSAKVAVALLVLGVPIIDTFWIIVRRVTQGRSPFSPDRTHIHHRLLDLGLSHRQTVLVIYGICARLAVLVACCCPGVTQLYAFLGVFVAFGLVLFLPTRGDFDRPDELEAEAYEPEVPTE